MERRVGACYKKHEDTIECLESLPRINYPFYEIVVVDNVSPNRSIDYLLRWAEKNRISYCYLIQKEVLSNATISCKNCIVTFIQSEVNGGYAYGNNLGIKYALKGGDFEYVLLINNDTIVDKDFLMEMISVAEKVNAGIVGSKIYF